MGDRLRRALPAVIGLVLFVAALEVLRRELHAITWHALTAAVANTPIARLAAATVLTVINYAVLTGYDFLAFAYIGKRLPRRLVAMASFLAYAIANNVGFAMLSGASVRYRFYTRWGVSGEELSRIVFSYSVTFWLGLLALGGISLAFGPLPGGSDLPIAELAKPVGWLLLAASVCYVVLTFVRTAPLKLRGWHLTLPRPRIAVLQFVVSAVDWTLAGAVFYALLPGGDASFLTVLGAFLAAQLLGLASHVPGGIGVFEGLMVLLLKPYAPTADLLPALIAYRVIYYLVPLVIALLVLVIDEAHRRREDAARIKAHLGRLAEEVTPRIVAIAAFVAGLILLFSGATPAARGRLAFLDRFLPLGIIETSHVLGSIAGTVLILLSQGLARRLDAAYYLAVIAISTGVVASLLKGGDFEEALLLLGLLAMLHRARPAFDRKAALFATRFSPTWTAAFVSAIVASVWLGLFAFKHVEYSNDLWWQFELNGQASRFLRGSFAAAFIALVFGVARLFGAAPHEADPPSDDDLRNANAIIGSQPATYPNLVYLRDKSILFDQPREAFVMYAVQSRTWVALGDPVGPPASVPDLIRLFLERCDDFAGTPVFYEIGKRYLHHYVDFGLTFVKLGEEARVDLERFTLDGNRGAKPRQIIRRFEKDGCTFRVLPASDVKSIIGDLRVVSDDWLKEKSGGEKGFSLGSFDPDYLERFPVAVVERGGHIQAFANLWLGADKDEMSVDLMRYHHEAPRSVMEALFLQLMRWGQHEGYQWFALGMAPMSGFEASPVAPLWTRVGRFLYEHGGGLYNFQGLRAYKDKFDPVWEPHYLAYPGGLKLPRVLADVSALVAGGYRHIFTK